MTKEIKKISSDNFEKILKTWSLVIDATDSCIKLMHEKEPVMCNYIQGHIEDIDIMEILSISKQAQDSKKNINRGIRLTNDLHRVPKEHFEQDFDFTVFDKLDEVTQYAKTLKKKLADELKVFELHKETVFFKASKNGGLELDFLDVLRYRGL